MKTLEACVSSSNVEFAYEKLSFGSYKTQELLVKVETFKNRDR